MDAILKSFLIAVTDSPAGNDLSIERTVLSEMRVALYQERTKEGLIDVLRDCDAVMCMHVSLSREVIEEMRHCKVIVRYGTGLDNIDLPAAALRGIPVVGIHNYCTEEVAEHVLALLLAWNRKIAAYDSFVRRGRWNQRRESTGNWGCGQLFRLSNQTLGLVGFGLTGRAVAQRALAFGMKVIAYSRSSRPGDHDMGVRMTTKNELLATSDYVSLHMPLTAETTGWLDMETISLMKRGAVLINTARGGLVAEDAVIRSLSSGQLGGALLDVYHKAPLPLDHPLRSLSNVIFTPHVAFYSEDSLSELRHKAAEAVRDHLAVD